MAIGGSPAGAPRAKDGSRGAAGRFVFVAEVARGYLGALWLARDGADSSDLGTVYVRHVTPLVAASARAAILEGARWAMAGADSPAFEVLEGRNAVDLITPFAEAEPLRSLLRSAAVKHATIEPEVLLGLAEQWVRSLAALHERARATKALHAFGAAHPDSVLVDLTGQVHLVDVGSGAAASAREPWRSDPQRVGYFAPEQLETRGVIDARTDVFAVGIALWEALANRRLFPGNDAKTARDRVQKAPIARLDATRPSAAPGVSTTIADLVARCLERDPGARFQSMEELGRALSEIQTAPPARIGAWVASLADSAIGKRRQALERAGTGSAAGGHGRESVPPPSSHGDRPSVSPDRPTKPSTVARSPTPPTVAEGRPSTPPRPGVAAPDIRAPETRPSLPAKPAVTPPPPSARAAEARQMASPKPSVTPPPPSARAAAQARPSAPPKPAVTPPPPSARAAAEGATIGTALPRGSRGDAAATPIPPSRRSVPPRPRGAAEEPTLASAAAATTPHAPEAAPPADAPRPPADSAENIESLDDEEPAQSDAEGENEAAPRAPADSVEAIEPIDEEPGSDGADREASIPPEPSKRPPPLPHDDPLSAGHGEPLANPIHTTTLASLTAPGPPAKNPLIRLAVAALAVAVAASGFILLRAKPKVRTVVVEQPARVERTVETPPVRIEEQLSAVPSAGAAPSALAETPSGSATPPVGGAAPAESATRPAPNAEASNAPKPVSHTAPAVEAPRHPAPAPALHDKQKGFKPGGI